MHNPTVPPCIHGTAVSLQECEHVTDGMLRGYEEKK